MELNRRHLRDPVFNLLIEMRFRVEEKTDLLELDVLLNIECGLPELLDH